MLYDPKKDGLKRFLTTFGPLLFTKNQLVKKTFMKSFLLFMLCAFLLIRLDAQSITENKSDDSHPFSLGVGTGFDNFTGLVGVTGTLRVSDMLSLRGGFGVGGWGTKSSVAIKFDKGEKSKWAYVLGYTANSGLKDFKTELETSSGSKRDVALDLLSTSTLNLAFDRNWRVGRRNLFYLEFGYAVPLQGQRWKITDGTTISGNSEQAVNMAQPGGIIFGAGFAFGL